MNKIIKLLKYLFSLYIHSNRIITPLVTWIVFLYFGHTIFPIDIISSTATSGIVLFLIMTWVGFSYNDMESHVTEQVMILRVNDEAIYYASKIIFLLLIGIFFSLIGILVPQLQNITHGFKAFTRHIYIYEVFISLLLHIITASVGVVTSGLFQARIITNRKLASLIILLVSVLAIVKGEIIKKVSILKFVFWIFPPIDNVAENLANKTYFEANDVVSSVLVCLTFCICASIIQVYLLKKRKF